MPFMQYRLDEGDYPVLYEYKAITPEETALRFACDYFVKDGIVYEVTARSKEDGVRIAYVQAAAGEQPVPSLDAPPWWKGIRIEMRRYIEGSGSYPLLTVRDMDSWTEALLELQCDCMRLDGRLWSKTSSEIDEDRKVYVMYWEGGRDMSREERSRAGGKTARFAGLFLSAALAAGLFAGCTSAGAGGDCPDQDGDGRCDNNGGHSGGSTYYGGSGARSGGSSDSAGKGSVGAGDAASGSHGISSGSHGGFGSSGSSGS